MSVKKKKPKHISVRNCPGDGGTCNQWDRDRGRTCRNKSWRDFGWCQYHTLKYNQEWADKNPGVVFYMRVRDALERKHKGESPASRE